MEDLNEYEMYQKLQKLWDGLKELTDRSEVDEALPQVLWSSEILSSNSEDVHTLFMCCITELYRLWSPNFPYWEPHQLKAICVLYMKNLAKLKTSEINDCDKEWYIIENLARTQGYFNSCLKSDDCIMIFVEMLKQIFLCIGDNVQLEKVSHEIAANLVSVASDPYIPAHLLNIVLENFSSIDNKMPSHVQKFDFANILISSKIDLFKSSLYKIFFDYFILGIEKDDFQYYENWYEILYNLSMYSHEVTLAIFPLIEKKLSSIKKHERLDAVRFFGMIFQLKLRFANHFQQIWSLFLERFLDEKNISLTCISMVPGIIYSHHELTEDLLEALFKAGNMSSKEVRYEVIRSVNVVVSNHPLFIASQEKFWLLLKERADEKEDLIRNGSLRCLANIYDILISETFLSNKTMENVTWAGHKILTSYLVPGVENKFMMIRFLFKKLVPYNHSTEQRMERLLKLLIKAPEITFQAFKNMLIDQYRLRKAVTQWFNVIQSNGDENNIIKLISLMLGAECDALELLSKHLSENDNFLLYAMDAINPLKSHSDRVTITSNLLDQETDVEIILKTIMERLVYIVDKEALKILMMNIEMLSHNDESNEDNSLKLLEVFAEVFPELFFEQELLSYLASFLQLQPPDIFAAFTKLSVYSEVQKIFVEIAEEHDMLTLCFECLNSSSSKLVKESCYFILAYFSHNEYIMNQYCKIILDNLASESVTDVTSGLIALGHMIFRLSDVSLSRKCIPKVKDMILLDIVIEEPSFSGSILCSKEKLPVPTVFKLEAVKTLIRLIKDTNEINENVIFLIDHQNHILKQEYRSEAEQHWISVTLFSSLLKIYCFHPSQELLPLYLETLYFILSKNAETYIYLNKLSKYLLKGLSLDFIGLYCVVIPKNDKALKRKALNLLCKTLEKKKVEMNELEGEDNSEVWIVSSLAVICESQILNVLDRDGLAASIKFILKPILPLSQHLSYYCRIIDEARFRISSNPTSQATDELKKVIRQAVKRV